MVSSELLNIDIPATSEVPAHRLAYLRWGNPHAEHTLICVHGLTRNAHDFDFLSRVLATDNICIICPDMAGRGASDWLSNTTDYSYSTYVADCRVFLQAMNLTHVHWLGTSMGGIIGLILANAAPGLLRSLILNDIGCLVPAAGLRRIAAYVGKQMTFANLAEGETALRAMLSPFGLTGEMQWRHLLHHSLRELPDGTAQLIYDPGIATAFSNPDAIQDVDLWPLWKGVQTLPLLLIRGAQSDILLKDTAVKMQAEHPFLTYHEIINAGHAPALMDDAQIALIKNWLATV